MILLQTDPNEWRVLLVLGITSAVFFMLIILIHYLKRQWRVESEAKKSVAVNSELTGIEKNG
jgi:uncharacterized protein (DUF58 family)